MRKFLILLIGLGLFMGWGTSARAQSGAQVNLYSLDASAFPTVSAFMDVFDASSRFVSGLKPEDVTVLEDGNPLPVQELNEMVVPAQIVVAINPGPSLDIRDARGVPPFDDVRQALDTWASALPSDPADDLSLVSISGPIINHASAGDWLVSLNAYQPDFRSTTPNLQSLSLAIDTAAVQTPQIGMKRAVLFITPHMDDPNIDTQVQPLIERAVQNKVRVFVWFVDSDLYAATTSAAAFNDLALQTGGAFFSSASGDPYPNPDSYFAPLRRLYSLKYNSNATAGGSHTFALDIKTPAGDIKSSEQPFTIDIQPPNPIFVSPPLQIVRRPPESDPYNDKILLPTSQEIDIIIEFPDQHERPLVRTTLYVDGTIEAENTTAPFDKFNWDISKYDMSGQHKLVVEAVDSLGLSKTSMEIPVTLTVVQPPHGLTAIFARYKQYITWGAVGFAGLVLLLIIFMGRLRTSFARRRTSRQVQADPVTQPILTAIDEPITGETKKTRGGRKAASKVKTKRVDAPAYLRRLIPDSEAGSAQVFKPLAAPPIALMEKEITFGTDPVQSSHVLDDPSLSARHARLNRTEDGRFLLTDSGSVAGTWVNFEPVGAGGHLLEHGDVVHFGQLIFRFELKDPPSEPDPKIVKENP